MLDIVVKHRTLQFTKEELQQILTQYNRTIDSVQDDVDCIKKWIDSQPHLTQTPSDRLILSMLMKHKFNIEKLKTNLDYYYSVRSKIPEVFHNCLPTNPEIINMRKIGQAFTLPKLVNLNRVIFFVVDEKDRKFDAYTCIANIVMTIEAINYMDLSNSFEIIWDCTNINLAMVTAFSIKTLNLFATLFQKFCCNRYQAMRIIGLPTFAQILATIGLAFLSWKLQKRVTYHSDPSEMAKYYPKELLPVEYGGSGPAFREMSKDFYDMVDTCSDYFQNIQNYEVNEQLRPTNLDNVRKLDID